MDFSFDYNMLGLQFPSIDFYIESLLN